MQKLQSIGDEGLARNERPQVAVQQRRRARTIGSNFQPRVANSRRKRALDITLSSTGIIILLPTLILIGLLVWLSSSGPILFRQSRTGLNGQPFKIYKFRTMFVLEDGDGLRHATRNDNRVTRVGALLRMTSLDELPQLLNVLKGDMSLVGPRPHAVSHDRHYGGLIGEYQSRFATKPGMTGLAQVRGHRGEIHDLTCMIQRIEADCEYIRRWSLFLDLMIIVQTVPRVFADRKAY